MPSPKPLPSWGDLRPVVYSQLVHLDHDHLRDWMAGERKLMPVTIDDWLRTLRRMERLGFTGTGFLHSPDHARLEGRRVLAKVRLAGGSNNALRSIEKVLNCLAQYAASVDGRYQFVKWQLSPELASSGKSIAPELAEVALQYRVVPRGRRRSPAQLHHDQVKEKRRRALLWLSDSLGWRRSEIALMRVQDLDERSGLAHLSHPAKAHGAMAWPLPRDAWSPKRPLQAWLAVRPVDPDNPDALWTHQRYPGDVPRAYTVAGIGREMDAISQELGFRVGFVRYRRADTIRLDDAEVSMRVIQAKRNHTRIDTTLRYAGKVTPERALAELARKRVAGYRAASRSRPVDAPDSLVDGISSAS